MHALSTLALLEMRISSSAKHPRLAMQLHAVKYVVIFLISLINTVAGIRLMNLSRACSCHARRDSGVLRPNC